jgi:hypothetical protein
MAPDCDEDPAMLSDKELLDSIERLLSMPGFIDLCLGYDAASNTFYAGGEVATGLRDVLRRVLRENRPSGLSLHDLTVHSCPTSHDGIGCAENRQTACEIYPRQVPLA